MAESASPRRAPDGPAGEESAAAPGRRESWDDAAAEGLNLDPDIKALSQEAYSLLNQIMAINETSESTDGKAPTRRTKVSQDDTGDEDDDDMAEELDRVGDFSEDIKALKEELSAAQANAARSALVPVQPSASEGETQLELADSLVVSCAPKLRRGHGDEIIRYDPAVEELKEVRLAIANQEIGPPPPRNRAVRKEVPGRLENGVDQILLVTCILIWTVIVILVDHARTDMMDSEGVLQPPRIFRFFS